MSDFPETSLHKEYLEETNPHDSKTVEEEKKRRYHDLLTLSRVSAAVSGLQDLDAILSVALDNVLNIMDGTVGSILLLDEQSHTLSYRVHRGMSTEYVQRRKIALGEGIAGWVAQTGKAILREDIVKDRDYPYRYPEWVKPAKIRSFVSVPLRSKEDILGVMDVASQTPRRFTKDDMYLLHSIGDQLGIAVENTRLYEQLTRGRERYRKLARQTLLAREAERQRISRELHDETSQSLSGLALNLQALVDMAEMSGKQDVEFIGKLKKVQSLAVQISKEVNKLINDLRPTLLDTLGMVPAIRQYAETTLQPLNITVTMSCDGDISSLPAEIEVGLFRVAQGAIGNIALHSSAKKADISLERKGNQLQMFVSDDGSGFNVCEITEIEDSGRGRGLFSMKERVKMLGGKCSVQSESGKGTIVTVRVPVIRDLGDDEDKSTSS
ncbi:MAG: GAF domain-containing sensor histidine kinase [Chloroflexota bacterium]|nr:GAF domain-containing sensor histidine kinase [Chloroflexota bacterium]